MEIEFVAIVIGTEDDPQNMQSQIEQLKEAGVIVFRTATEAVNISVCVWSVMQQMNLPQSILNS